MGLNLAIDLIAMNDNENESIWIALVQSSRRAVKMTTKVFFDTILLLGIR